MTIKEAIEKLKNPDQFFAKQFKQLLEEFKKELEELKQQKDELLAIDKEEIIDEILKEVKKDLENKKLDLELENEKFLKVFNHIEKIKGETGKTGDRGEQGIQGLKGDTGLQGISGKDGQGGKNGLNGKNGKDGLNGLKGDKGEDGSPEKPEDIVKKLNKTEESVKISVIKGLENYLKKLGQSIQQKTKGGGGMGNWVHQSFNVNSSTTTITLSNNIAANGFAIMAFYQGQFIVRGTHYTQSGKVLTLTFTPDNSTVIDTAYVRT